MKIKLLLIILIALIMSGCSIPAPKYSPSFDNVTMLKKANSPVDVTDFTGATAGLGTISLRGNTLESPHGKDLIYYIQFALESELEKAGLLKEDSTKKLSAVIEKNDIDTAISSPASGKIKATFVVTDRSVVLYKKSVVGASEWESSFLGAVAIPRAAESYPKIVVDLLKNLYSDKDFISALSQ